MGSIAALPEFGKRLIPRVLDDLAATEPNRIIYSLAKSSDISQGFREISARLFTQAVDKLAWWLHDQIERKDSIQPLAYIGPHDIRHILLTYAAVKVGCTALFLSPKNNTEAALAVLKTAGCNIWIQPREQVRLPLVNVILEQRPMRVFELPEVNELLDASDARFYPYFKTWEEAEKEPFCLLHTSGSTGLPKPISWPHNLIGTMDAVRLLPSVEGDGGLLPWTQDWKDGDRIYSSFPMSHGAGVIMDIIMPALFRMHCILGPPGVIPNMNLIDSIAEHGNINVWSMVPSLTDELGETPDVLEKFKSSKFICASGGPVSPISAAKVNKVVRVLNLTGTTEGLFIGNLVVEREDWLYFCFHPWSGFEFKEVEPGVFEHWVHRNEHGPLFQGIFHTFPDQKSINLKDLYIKHPTKPDLWAYKGRNDDVVVLSNSYKINPLDSEALITTHPAINGCLMIGTAKPQAGLLIELKDPANKSPELIDSIWSIVEKANKLSMHKNQLQKDYVTFAEADKPFIRTDKGTVKRRATLELYADFVERFYESRLEEGSDVAVPMVVNLRSSESVEGLIRHVLNSLLPTSEGVSKDTDLFTVGLDSILVYRVVKKIKSAVGLQDRLAPRHLYANPTIASFVTALSQMASVAGKKPNGLASEASMNDEDRLRELIRRYGSQQPAKMNAFDMSNPNIYGGLNFFFPLREGIQFAQAFSKLQEGLQRALELIPVVDGKVMQCSDQEMGYKKGDLRLTLPPLPSTATRCGEKISPLRQLLFNDLSGKLPSFQAMKDADFVFDFEDAMFNSAPWTPVLPADVLIAQANFVEGGCILAINLHHACFDGSGCLIFLRAWAESCRFVSGDKTATCDWLQPESFNPDLLHILYEQEGYARPAEEVDPSVWGFTSFASPAEHPNGNTVARSTAQPSESVPLSLPAFPRQFGWPPAPPKDGRNLKSATFLIPSENVEKLRQSVLADPESKGVITSVNDIVQAFFWRAAIKARLEVAQSRGEIFSADDPAILEIPLDARPYFSSALPATYMGNLLVINRPIIPVEKLCSPDTSIASIALLIRQAVGRITPQLVHDVFTVLQTLPDYGWFSNACMGFEGMHTMMNNLILFQTSEISFGSEIFGNGGSPEVLRLQVDRANTQLRSLVILPMRKDGGVELLLGTLPEEFEMLTKDEEFTRFARFLG